MSMTQRNNTPEFTSLWNDWLKSDQGKGYEAGWTDHASRWHAAHGVMWVYEQMLDRREHEIAKLKAELAGAEPVRLKLPNWPTVAEYDATKKDDFQA